MSFLSSSILLFISWKKNNLAGDESKCLYFPALLDPDVQPYSLSVRRDGLMSACLVV